MIIHELRNDYKLSHILKALDFPKSVYMYWQKKFNNPVQPDIVETEILNIVTDHKGRLGYRRVNEELRKLGYVVNHKKVLRLTRKLGLLCTKYSHKSRRYNSYKGTIGKIAPNRLNRRFETNIPHQKITTDTTEFKYYEQTPCGKTVVKKLYLDPFLDMYNSEIISYRISKAPNARAILEAQEEAIKVTADCKYRRTFCSDQGWGYQMKAYIKRLKEEKIFQSMSRKGNCHDNSVMENFFGLLKQEMYYGETFVSFEELESAIIEYIEYYNTKRSKQKLDYLSPVEYRISNSPSAA
jgi:transposase InsO family protein